jgi:hypothetical protein
LVQHEDVNFAAAMQVQLLIVLMMLMIAMLSRPLQTVGEYFDDFVMDCVGNWLPSRWW